jgi:hypothetical protein
MKKLPVLALIAAFGIIPDPAAAMQNSESRRPVKSIQKFDVRDSRDQAAWPLNLFPFSPAQGIALAHATTDAGKSSQLWVIHLDLRTQESLELPHDRQTAAHKLIMVPTDHVDSTEGPLYIGKLVHDLSGIRAEILEPSAPTLFESQRQHLQKLFHATISFRDAKRLYDSLMISLRRVRSVDLNQMPSGLPEASRLHRFFR